MKDKDRVRGSPKTTLAKLNSQPQPSQIHNPSKPFSICLRSEDGSRGFASQRIRICGSCSRFLLLSQFLHGYQRRQSPEEVCTCFF